MHNLNTNTRFIPPVMSTHCSDPAATHIVTVAGGDFGYGIFGYYTNIFDAHRVQRALIKAGASISGVEAYNPESPNNAGIHPLIEAHFNGYV